MTDRVDQIVEVVFGPRRAVDRQGLRPVVEPERLDQSRNPENVVAVEVRDEQVVDPETGSEPHHAALRALSAVEQQAVALAVDEQCARRALGGRNGAARPEEGDAKGHVQLSERHL